MACGVKSDTCKEDEFNIALLLRAGGDGVVSSSGRVHVALLTTFAFAQPVALLLSIEVSAAADGAALEDACKWLKFCCLAGLELGEKVDTSMEVETRGLVLSSALKC